MTESARHAAGDLIEIEIEKLVAGGEGMGRAGGLVVFARPAYPGDLVRVRLTESHRSFARGEVEEVLRASEDRRASPCPIAERCGGCDWTSYRLDAQLRAKRAILLESLRRIGKIEESSVPPVRIHGSALSYRLRSRLHVDAEGRAGFYGFRSHEVVPIVPECEVVGPLLRDRIEDGSLAATPGGEIVALENERELLLSGSDEDRRVLVQAGGFSYELALNSFFQVNRHLLTTLIDLVAEHASRVRQRDLALDLYGGAAFFALPLSTLFTRVISVESDQGSHQLAVRNTTGRPIELARRDVRQFLDEHREKPGMILLDPPRSGTHPRVIDAIDRLEPEIVSYLSCDPVNLARDLHRFGRAGWTLSTVDLIDLFPNTHHVETLVSLRRS